MCRRLHFCSLLLTHLQASFRRRAPLNAIINVVTRCRGNSRKIWEKAYPISPINGALPCAEYAASSLIRAHRFFFCHVMMHCYSATRNCTVWRLLRGASSSKQRTKKRANTDVPFTFAVWWCVGLRELLVKNEQSLFRIAFGLTRKRKKRKWDEKS